MSHSTAARPVNMKKNTSLNSLHSLKYETSRCDYWRLQLCPGTGIDIMNINVKPTENNVPKATQTI